MLRLPLVFAATVLGMMLAIDLAYGQLGPGGTGPMGPGGMKGTGKMGRPSRGGMVGLLRHPNVQKDLNLSDEQKEKANELLDELGRMSMPKQGEQLEQGEFMRRMQNPMAIPEVRERAEKGLAEILKPEQLARLKEIGLQAQGPAAFSNPEVVKTLAITDEQKEKFAELNKQTNEQRQKMIQSQMDLSPEERMEKRAEMQAEMQKLHQKLTADSLGVLTPEQREKFEKMTGKKIDLTPPQRQRQRRGNPNVQPSPNQPNVQPPS
jgi:hypothetical protein